LKIAVSGSHGCGKTKLINELFKQANGNKVILPEIARECPLPINQKQTLESSLWMFHNQMRLELEYGYLYDTIICDRSIVDSIAYSLCIHGEHKYLKHIKEFTRDWLPTYNKIYFLTIKNNNYFIDDGIRDMDSIFRQKIEDKMLELYKEFNYNINTKMKTL